MNMLNYNDFFISKSMQFSVGRNSVLDIYYVSFSEPTPNRQSDYEVYYKLPGNLIYMAEENPEELINFVNECRHGMHRTLKIKLKDE